MKLCPIFSFPSSSACLRQPQILTVFPTASVPSHNNLWPLHPLALHPGAVTSPPFGGSCVPSVVSKQPELGQLVTRYHMQWLLLGNLHWIKYIYIMDRMGESSDSAGLSLFFLGKLEI